MTNYICIQWNEQWKPRRVNKDFETNKMSKCICIWWNKQWYNENLEHLSKSVKHTKWPSALTYDEMNIHVKKGE